MTNLETIKYNSLSTKEKQEIAQILINEYNSLISVGMIFYNDTYHCNGVINDLYLKDGKLYIVYTLHDEDDEEFRKREETIVEFMQYNHNKFLFSDPKQFNEDVDKLVSGITTINELVDKKFGLEPSSNSTELMLTNKNSVIERRDELIMKREFVAARHAKMKNLLETRTRELYKVVDEFRHSIAKVNKLIIQLELYLGVEETIEQIQVGNSAPEDMPISLRQRILYMDVEVGDPADDGIDISNVEEFDKWLLRSHPYWKMKNYEILIPEQKCIAVFKVRRSDKEYNYSSNPFINAFHNSQMNELNRKTYIFMRNGENIYKIWSDIINIDTRLFPRKEELNEIFEEINKFSGSYTGQKADGKLHGYKLHFLIIQGVFERTQIFQNSQSINLFDSNVDNSTKVQYIYDDEIATQLPSGIPTFGQWQKKLNETIEEGTRIYFIHDGFMRQTGYRYYNEEIRKRIFKEWFQYDDSYPNKAPSNGLYVVYNETEKKFVGKDNNQLYIKYNYKRNEWNETRGKGYSFAIGLDDKCILNYDAISYKDMEILEYYLYTRIGREQYLSYIPLLLEVFKMKKAELDKEQEFVKLILSNVKLEDTTENREQVMKTIEWWKVKNKWKRSLSTDDAKAYRMISKEMESLKDTIIEVKRKLDENGC